MNLINIRTVSKHWLVPYERNPDFTGRIEQFYILHTMFRESERCRHRVALYGLGGVGKTEFALEFVYRFRDEYDHVFWINAVDELTILSGFRAIA